MSDAAVARATGKTWTEWTALLDAADAATLPHADIARLAAREEGTSDWWAQMVAVAYERFRGLRDVGQRRGGGYDVNKSRTFGVPVESLFQAFYDDEIRARWLPDVDLTIGKATPNRSMRIRLADGGPLDAYFTAKSETRSSVNLQHRNLADRDEATRMKELWGERLGALADVVRGD